MRKNDMYEDIYSSDTKFNKKYVDIYSEDRKKNQKKKQVSIAKVVSVLFFLILGLIGAFMIYCYNTLHSINFDNSIIQDDVDAEDSAFSDQSVLNVLLIGSDTLRPNENGRSDSLLILSLNLKAKKIKVTSLMRDLWVNIPGHGPNRLNAAFSFGGAQLAIDTVRMNFGIHIDGYVAAGFGEFIKMVDTLGGVDLQVSNDEAKFINKNVSNKSKLLSGAGLWHLNGDQTLQYTRNRDSAGSDYDRTQRQRTVIMTIFKQLKAANISQITQSIKALLPTITTSFKSSEILKLSKNAVNYLKFGIEDFRLPTNDKNNYNVESKTYYGMMVLVIKDLAKARADLYNFIYEPKERSIPEKIINPPEKVRAVQPKSVKINNSKDFVSKPTTDASASSTTKHIQEKSDSKNVETSKSENNNLNDHSDSDGDEKNRKKEMKTEVLNPNVSITKEKEESLEENN